ncbi:MAG: tetratricopeptide repeat protein [Opitutaceae bacterium]
MSSNHSSAAGAYQRGCLLRSQHRIDDAINAFKQVLQENPNHAPSLSMLALCWTEKEGHSQDAVEAAKRAVAVEPEDAFARTVLAIAIENEAKPGQKSKLKEALSVAHEAIEMDPDLDVAHALAGSLQLRLEKRAEAEQSARKALSINPENTMAGEVLSAALLLQRKSEDNDNLIDAQLRRDPNDDSTHSNAGWQALMSGDHVKANTHFTEALRLNPMNERARMGLIESFRARSAPYRLQLKFANFMNQFTAGKQTMIMIGAFIFYKVAYGSVSTVSPILGNVVLGLWLIFALWSHLARGLSTFYIVIDKFARRALRPMERWEGISVGGCLLLSIVSITSGLFINPDNAGDLALIFLFAGVANAAAFTNDHHIGKYVYFGIAGICTLASVYCGLSLFLPNSLPSVPQVYSIGLLLGVAITWLRGFGAGYR